jgi:hypothetical protein
MQDVRRVILYLSAVIGVWALVSFGGAMFDSANAAFWADSLLWSLLSCLIVMPALLMANHASTGQPSREANESGAVSEDEQESFVQDSREDVQTLWPEPDQEGEWPPNDDIAQEQHSQRSAHAEA